MGFKKILGLTLVFTASIAMFIYFFILNIDFWTKLTNIGWYLLIIIFAILLLGIVIYLKAKK